MATNPSPKGATSWSASYQDVVAVEELDPNKITASAFDQAAGDAIPDYVRDQWDCAIAMIRAGIGSKALGVTTKFDVQINGSATPGHDQADQIQITLTANDTPSMIERVSEDRQVEYVVTQGSYGDTSGPGVGE